MRFYRGVGPALIQGPMSRFGDTAANAGTLALLDSYDSTSAMPVSRIHIICTLTFCCCRWRLRLILLPCHAVASPRADVKLGTAGQALMS